MDISKADWAKIGSTIRARRLQKFKDKKAAYTKAELNSATWDRLEAGLSVKEGSLIAAVRTLWPESQGDWAKVDVGADVEDASYVASPGERAEGGSRDDEVLREIRAVREEQQRMSERLARVEERLADS